MVLGALIQYHDEIMEKFGDPRSKGYPLMSSPFPTIAICLTYVYLVKYVGPELMRNRKPYELKMALLIYNLFQVILSTFTVYKGLSIGLMTTISLGCYPVDYTDSYEARTAVFMSWVFYMSKYVEMLDTVFFIMRKKMNQVSTLHVFHHGIMPLSVWWGTKFIPGGQAAYWAFWNAFVHVMMYSYYLLAGLGPGVRKYLWWKKYLTVLQLVQFVAIWFHSTQVLFNGCNYSKLYSAYISAHGVLFFCMFYQFYKKEYSKGGKSKKEAIPKTLNVCSPSASNRGKFYEHFFDRNRGKSQ